MIETGNENYNHYKNHMERRISGNSFVDSYSNVGLTLTVIIHKGDYGWVVKEIGS